MQWASEALQREVKITLCSNHLLVPCKVDFTNLFGHYKKNIEVEMYPTVIKYLGGKSEDPTYLLRFNVSFFTLF